MVIAFPYTDDEWLEPSVRLYGEPEVFGPATEDDMRRILDELYARSCGVDWAANLYDGDDVVETVTYDIVRDRYEHWYENDVWSFFNYTAE